MPVISVIIPCYNQGSLIDDAVDSVLAQTFGDFEIIIVNDGSTDPVTNEKLSGYSKAKTTVIHTENRGVSAARNTGLGKSSGKFIQFLDADDIIFPTKFAEQLAVLNDNPGTDICYTDYRIYNIDKGAYLDLPPRKYLGDNPLEDFLFRWERGLSIPLHCALFDRKIWPDNIAFNEKLRAEEDWMMWCDAALKKTSFLYLNRELVSYRHHGGNKTGNKLEMYYSFFLVVNLLSAKIPEKYRESFLHESIKHNRKLLENDLQPDLVNTINDLRDRIVNMDKTIDYRLGNAILKPYRFIKKKVFGKEYLVD